MTFNWRPTTAPVQTRYDDIWFISPQGARTFSWNFKTDDGVDAGTGHFMYRISIDGQATTGMAVRPARAAPDALGVQVAQLIKRLAPRARRAHDDLVLPGVDGEPKPLSANSAGDRLARCPVDATGFSFGFQFEIQAVTPFVTTPSPGHGKRGGHRQGGAWRSSALYGRGWKEKDHDPGEGIKRSH
jgi:hypothetical protein